MGGALQDLEYSLVRNIGYSEREIQLTLDRLQSSENIKFDSSKPATFLLFGYDFFTNSYVELIAKTHNRHTKFVDHSNNYWNCPTKEEGIDRTISDEDIKVARKVISMFSRLVKNYHHFALTGYNSLDNVDASKGGIAFEKVEKLFIKSAQGLFVPRKVFSDIG
ncbi:MAG TPA: hypothetical protein VI564_01430 [Candidatus Nanoarchaeia archaeon]|nr:hypothetical protein [Candidatus Nanoarchaeia archaeon]